jgi:flavin-dependent dehydrogenase
MQRCDVLVVGGGPAGSTCAWRLRRAGLDVIVLDRARFPRDKVCAGWVTPAVLESLELEPDEYRSAGLVLQELRGFRTGVIGGPSIETKYSGVVSFGVRRCEFDYFLLRRSRACVLDDRPLTKLRRAGDLWIANEEVQAPMIVGAGGHFCPVALFLNKTSKEGLVIAREYECRLSESDACPVDSATAELFFSRDLEGYGWCVRKNNYLNVGFGRRGAAHFDAHVRGFIAFLTSSGRAPGSTLDLKRWRGHAYRLAGMGRPVIADGLLLVGDSAGLAYPESGEGIGPAVRSAIVAAQAIVSAGGSFNRSRLAAYEDYIHSSAPAGGFASWLQAFVPAAVGRTLLNSPRFARLAIDRWFLRTA